jgi:hypothetical protein
MNRRNFLKVLGAAIAAPFVVKAKPIESKPDYGAFNFWDNESDDIEWSDRYNSETFGAKGDTFLSTGDPYKGDERARAWNEQANELNEASENPEAWDYWIEQGCPEHDGKNHTPFTWDDMLNDDLNKLRDVPRQLLAQERREQENMTND